ncbi:MAG: EAL domain-containing protein [Granulosicoccus sp.]|nr:EAL domain-containing protein [Granulosicoccus sp.]
MSSLAQTRTSQPLPAIVHTPLQQRLALLETLVTPFWIFDIQHFSMIWANESALRVWQADSLSELNNRDFAQQTSAAVIHRLEQFQSSFEQGEVIRENWTIHPKGKPVTYLMQFHGVVLDDGRTAMLVEALYEDYDSDPDNLRSTQALLHTPVMVSMYSRDGDLLYSNPAARDMLGNERSNLEQHFCHREDYETASIALTAEKELSMECRVNTVAGPAWHQINIQSSHDCVDGGDTYLISELDITQRRAAEQRINVLAYSDPLTGLPNRTYINEKLPQFIASANRYKQQIALIYIDLDRFKIVNDSLGHGVGDGLLRKAATLLQSAVRSTDQLIRLGGDEFLVVIQYLPDATVAMAVADRVLGTLRDTVTIDGHELRLSASMGVSIYPADGLDAVSIMKNADLAMYNAKAEGGNCARRFDPSMGLHLESRLQMEVDLRRAISSNEFELHYQPRVSSKTGVIIGAEALIRWRHPERGMVSPVEFISLAEETGMIVDIGHWVLTKAVSDCARWHAEGQDISVSVNVSSRQFNSGQFAEDVLNVLRDADCPAQKLELELTESMLASEAATVRATLNQLKDTGVRIAIDDFGTGYSNLGYLKDFPIDKIKIDRSFVMNDGQKALVEMIVSLGKLLDVGLVAEGIETQEQCRWLQSLDCDEFQGYYFSRPLPKDKFELYHKEHACLVLDAPNHQ